jgi:putative DNA primase/helicase
MSPERLPPNNLDYERAVLGAAIADEDPGVLPRIVARLKAADFFDLKNQVIFAQILQMHAAAQPVTRLTIEHALREAGKLEHAGGAAHLALCFQEASISARVDHYTTEVIELSTKRQLLDLSHAIERQTLSGTRSSVLLAGLSEDTAQLARRFATDSKGKRVEVDAGVGDLQRLREQIWQALAERNDPPWLFRREGKLVRIGCNDDGRPMIETLSESALTHHLANEVSFFEDRMVGRELRRVDVPPPLRLVKDLLVYPDPRIPVVTRIIETPFFTSKGFLHLTPGYASSSRLYYAPRPGLAIPPVSAIPTNEEICRAREMLREVFCDFPLVGDPDRAHTLSLFLQPFVRELIAGPVPLFLVDKPTPGTGASLLVQAVIRTATGGEASSMTEAADEQEWRKRITAKLAEGPTIVFIDNVRRRLESGALSSVVTAESWEDRVLGLSEIVRSPVRCMWVITGNNITTNSEIARRSIRIRLDSGQERPWARPTVSFRHPDLLGWVLAERGALVHAALTLVQAWLALGRPAGKNASLGMFGAWSSVMGGILTTAGVSGFLGDIAHAYQKLDVESADVKRFLTAWWAKYPQTPTPVSDLYTIATSPEVLFPLGGQDDHGRHISLGRRLRELVGRPYEIAPGVTVSIARH